MGKTSYSLFCRWEDENEIPIRVRANSIDIDLVTNPRAFVHAYAGVPAHAMN
jgi:hypothetical protein